MRCRVPSRADEIAEIAMVRMSLPNAIMNVQTEGARCRIPSQADEIVTIAIVRMVVLCIVKIPPETDEVWC